MEQQGELEAKNGSRKRSRSSPFRVKIGNVVALRFRAQGCPILLVKDQSLSSLLPNEDMCSVWTQPVSGRDEGLALIGKRVRCSFRGATKDSKPKVLEGEIVGLIDDGRGQAGRTKIQLLVERTQYQHFPFLERIDDDIDEAKLPNKTARRNHRLEESIRGKDMITLKVILLNPHLTTGCNSPKACVQWAIQKCVPAKLFQRPPSRRRQRQPLTSSYSEPSIETMQITEDCRVDVPLAPNPSETKEPKASPRKTKRKPNSAPTGTTRHIGDGNDSPAQQINNWRWLSSRYHDLLLSQSHHEVDSTGPEVLSNGFVGEVTTIQPASEGSSTLAMVVLRRLFLPEHTASGRLPCHTKWDIFEDNDAICDATKMTVLIQIPIEHLIVICRNVHTAVNSNNISCTSLNRNGGNVQLVMNLSYSLRRDLYFKRTDFQNGTGGNGEEDSYRCFQNGTSGNRKQDGLDYCHRCRQVLQEKAKTCFSEECPLSRSGEGPRTSWCEPCLATIYFVNRIEGDDTGFPNLPCCIGLCDCRYCTLFVGSAVHEEFRSRVFQRLDRGSSRLKPSFFLQATSLATSIPLVDFGLSRDFLNVAALPIPSTRPSSRTTKLPKKIQRRPAISKVVGLETKKKKERKNGSHENGRRSDLREAHEGATQTEESIRDGSTCARMLVYNPTRKRCRPKSENSSSPKQDKKRNLREDRFAERTSEHDKDEKITTSRAARANQRRVLKGVSAIGSVSLGIDTLASREPQLRFGRSGIHAWGVFADKDIAAGEMIVEYRGELIGNSVAEKREKEYEAANIGSDYMFRVDGTTVCDATRSGNVARFLNASCGPNCYTKIITLDGNKRIVIYAKRDIRAGEELCYDYKFPVEYDESKRIPCYCGSPDCRGFMNWDKRYVAVPSTPESSGTPLM